MRNTVEDAYNSFLGIVPTITTNDFLEKMRIGSIEYDNLKRFAFLIQDDRSRNDDIEKFFSHLSDTQFVQLYSNDYELLEQLTSLLYKNMLNYEFPFSYTDIVGAYLSRFINNSSDSAVKANLIFTLATVGSKHNGWAVVGYAKAYLKNLHSSPATCQELLVIYQ